MPIIPIAKDTYKTQSLLASETNIAILNQFEKHWQDDDIKRTHLFNNRYENIYLNEAHIPELKPLISEAVTLAEKILHSQNLRAGYWFNYMPPGSLTTIHSHDDYDELLSGVYYVAVPENSGNLILHENSEKIEIEPKTGEFIFFKPDVRHEVSRNNSSQHRLSIGMNFGPDNSS
jgi:quercetin dioxygenase-like cupin family protein